MVKDQELLKFNEHGQWSLMKSDIPPPPVPWHNMSQEHKGLIPENKPKDRKIMSEHIRKLLTSPEHMDEKEVSRHRDHAGMLYDMHLHIGDKGRDRVADAK